MTSRWPTDLEPDGTAPVNIMLVAHGDEFVRRQAMYQLQAGVQLEDRGYQIQSFQVPLVGRMARITIPIALTTPKGGNAVVYTESEEWTADRLANLRAWMADLREDSDAAIIVASRVPPPAPDTISGVAEWLHLPYDTLNRAAPAAEKAEPVMPCLKERHWQGRERAVSRVLWENKASAYMPWVAVGYDRPHTFEFITEKRMTEMNTTQQALEAEALANLCARPAEWKVTDIGDQGRKLRMLTCTGDYFSAEQLLNAAFMRQAHQTLNARGLLVGIPRRGIMMAVGSEIDANVAAGFARLIVEQFRGAQSAPISPMLFAVRDGAVFDILETIADELLAGAAPGAAAPTAGTDANDPGAPYVTMMITRNDRGTEDVHVMAGGQDGARLALAIENTFLAAMKQHGGRKEFSGHVEIVVLNNTSEAARAPIPQTFEHLRGICAELSKSANAAYRVSLTYQQGDAPAPPVVAPGAPPRPARAAAPPPKPIEAPPVRKRRVHPVAIFLVVAAVIAFAVAAYNYWQFPPSLTFGGQRLPRATKWSRGGTSGAVYVPQGETLPGASLQIGVIVSTDHKTAPALLAWIREQAQSVGARNYDAGTDTETCVAGLLGTGKPGGDRSYIALQVCRDSPSRAACAESDEAIPFELFTKCLGNNDCFAEECDRRWNASGENLARLATHALGDNIY